MESTNCTAMTQQSNSDPDSRRVAGRLAVLEHASDAEPQDPSIHRAMAEAKRSRGDELGALAHLIAAQTLEAHACGAQAGSAMGLCNVATGYFMKGDYKAAARWYRLVLTIAPGLAIA